MNKPRSFKVVSAFTRVELVVVVAVVLALSSLLFLFINRDKEPGRRLRCAANLRQIGAALSTYSRDYHDLLPDCTRNNPKFFGSYWPWDLNRNVADELERRGAGRKVFYCPSNPDMDCDQRWNFYKYESGANRVVGYAFLMNGCVQVPRALWRTNLLGDGITSPAGTELAFDATLSQRGNYAEIKGKWVDRSNHLGRNGRPQGGNILFEDGHSEWKDFDKMRHRIFGDAVWDF